MTSDSKRQSSDRLDKTKHNRTGVNGGGDCPSARMSIFHKIQEPILYDTE